jgi:hypothetical protein
MNTTWLRTTVAVGLGLALTGPALWAGEQDPPAERPFHARRLGDRPSPPATLDAVAWLAGHWEGEGLGGHNEELWSPPRAGVMMGMYRLVKQDRPALFEFLMIVEESGTLVLKLKHFNPDFTGWEEKDRTVDFRLVEVEERAVHFSGLSFVRAGEDGLRIYLLLSDRKTGQTREEEFKLRRAASIAGNRLPER